MCKKWKWVSGEEKAKWFLNGGGVMGFGEAVGRTWKG